MLPSEVLTLQQVCEVLQLRPKTIYRLVARGKLRPVGGIRHVRITRKALDEFIAENQFHRHGNYKSQLCRRL